jgi:thiol:disulfide interchange protein DsbA
MTRRIRTLLIALLCSSTWAMAAGVDPFAGPIPQYQEGVHYKVDFPDQRSDKPEVIEFFSFGCPHCNHAEPQVERWLKSKPESIQFVRIPVAFGRASWALYARAYYLMQALKIEHKAVPAFFRLIHEEHRPPQNMADLKAFFVGMGVDPEAFDKNARSFWVESQMRRADQMAREFKVQGVPDFVINRHYRIVPGAARSEAEFYGLLTALALKDFK